MVDEIEAAHQKMVQEMAPALMHEMQSHLVNARNAAELIKFQIDSASVSNEKELAIYCDDILRSLQSCVRVVDAFTNISRGIANSQDRRSVSLDRVGTILKECIHLFRNRSQKFELQVADSPQDFFLDTRLLQHVAVNLIMNAAQFSVPGARVTIKCYLVEDNLTVSVENFLASSATCEVERSMDIGYSSKSNGAGYGLTISKQIADLLEGQLECRVVKDPESDLSIARVSLKVPVVR